MTRIAGPRAVVTAGAGLGLIAVTAAAAVTGLWVLTSIPIGFLFGFFLERADLCGAAACSEVVLMRDGRKLGGLWVAIAVSMLAFALGSLLGWVELKPKPLIWASYLVGGAVFGAGTVLAGGCVSGSLFKAGQGNLNSMAALAAIPIGVSAVAYGPLQGLNRSLRQHVLKAPDGGPVTFSSLTGLPYWLLALLLALATVALIALLTRRSRPAEPAVRPGADGPILQRVLARPWKPWQSGIAIGLLGLAALLSSAASGRNYPLGVTHGVLDVQVLLTDAGFSSVWHRAPAAAAAGHAAKHVVWWLVGVVTFLVAGSHVSARLRGSFRFLPKPPDETVVAFLGGLLVGAGAALGSGCVIGNILSGVALMSVGSVLFTVVVVLANWAVTRLYLAGGFR